MFIRVSLYVLSFGSKTHLQNGSIIEYAEQIANHESPGTPARLPAAGRATMLYDRTLIQAGGHNYCTESSA